jgi:hypothetical protein
LHIALVFALSGTVVTHIALVKHIALVVTLYV